MIQREQKFKENELLNAELSKKAAKVDEDLVFISEKAKNISKQGVAEGKQGEDMKIVETLHIEKKELRGEVELLTRSKQKLEASLKDLEDKTKMSQFNILQLASRLLEHGQFNRESALKGLKPEEKERVSNAVQKSPADICILIERLIIDNISMDRKILIAETKKLIN